MLFVVINMQHYFSKERCENNLILNDSDWHHIKNVMRMKNDDNIIVVYREIKYLCKIDVENRLAIIESEKNEKNESKVKISIAQGLIREQKLDIVLKMCTELGMYKYYPVIMERSVVKVDKSIYNKKVNRWQNICKESAEQSHRNFVPIISEILTINELSKLDYDLKLICSTRENSTNIKNMLHNSKKYDKILIVVGPEGGITIDEEQLLIENGFVPVSLGSRILRTETAPVYINSIINYDLVE